MTVFQPTGSVDSARLAGPRLGVHWALQVPAAAAVHRPGDDRGELAWDDDVVALLSSPLEPSKRRIGFKVRDLAVVSAGDDSYEAYPLAGNTLAEALAWAAGRLEQDELRRPNFVLPSHPVVRGGLFIDDDREALSEIERWIGNAMSVLSALDEPGRASCIPRTFAVVRELPGDVWAGVALGDRERSAPYWFARPKDAPARQPDAALDAGGRWHEGGWIGALLPGETLSPDEGQREQVRAFFTSALRALR